MKVSFSPPDMTEQEANEVREAILSGWITTGPRTKELERQISGYVGTEKTVCLNSATAAMEMVLHLLGVGPGDEVIVPAYTYTATASVVQHVGAKLVMVDSQTDNVEMNYNQLASAITERTKVIVPVDIAGIMADYDRVYEIVDGHRKAELLKLIAQVEKVNLAQTIAVGDGANDLPMISEAGLGIAFHAKPRVVANAEQSINTIGLDGVLYFLGFKDSYLGEQGKL